MAARLALTTRRVRLALCAWAEAAAEAAALRRRMTRMMARWVASAAAAAFSGWAATAASLACQRRVVTRAVRRWALRDLHNALAAWVARTEAAQHDRAVLRWAVRFPFVSPCALSVVVWGGGGQHACGDCAFRYAYDRRSIVLSPGSEESHRFPTTRQLRAPPRCCSS